jgi:hypothetical protein
VDKDHHFMVSRVGKVIGKSYEDSRNTNSQIDLDHLIQGDVWRKINDFTNSKFGRCIRKSCYNLRGLKSQE